MFDIFLIILKFFKSFIVIFGEVCIINSFFWYKYFFLGGRDGLFYYVGWGMGNILVMLVMIVGIDIEVSMCVMFILVD